MIRDGQTMGDSTRQRQHGSTFRAATTNTIRVKTDQAWALDDIELFWGGGSTWPCVFENEVLIIKLLPVDGFAPGAVVVGEVAALAHELGDDAVEAAPFEAKTFLVGAEAAEILCLGEKRSGGSRAVSGTGRAGRLSLLTHPRSWAPRPSAAGSAAAPQVCCRS